MNAVKIRRENLWNRIFHKREIREQKIRRNIETADEYLDELQECEGLYGLLDIHRKLWKDGMRTPKLAPDEFGMFRTKHVARMKPEEVYLGDIYGLWTFTIPEWEKLKDNKYGENTWGVNPEMTVYQLVVIQYKKLLQSGVKSIKRENEELLRKAQLKAKKYRCFPLRKG